jgi:hypothetical protein
LLVHVLFAQQTFPLPPHGWQVPLVQTVPDPALHVLFAQQGFPLPPHVWQLPPVHTVVALWHAPPLA